MVIFVPCSAEEGKPWQECFLRRYPPLQPRFDRMLDTLGVIRSVLQSAFDKLSGIPVDIEPIFAVR